MEWSEVEIHTVNEAVEPVANLLSEYGASGVAIEDAADFFKEREDQFGEIYALSREDYPEDGVIVKAYFLKTNEFLQQIPEMELGLRNLSEFDIPLGNFKFFVNDVNDEDWATAWKKYYHPVQITDHITVAPTWEEYTPRADELVIELDPGMAFGTGTHPTTQLSMRALSEFLKKGDRVIDVGTGSGVLAILSAKLGAHSVLALDLDEVAVRAARENVEQNQVANLVELRQNDLLNGINQEADLIVANILAEVILLFPKDVHRLLKPGGIFIASGIIEGKAEDVREALIEASLTVLETRQQGDWGAIIAKRGEE
ncbi:ribosomal protein L11 methyltransferase [Listeria floridensis FSL S10-1187]|uniref:Ribosomal protein L11 methyltransferase n=1 Tax=Listeria floridensis FSL S10-1187 TaxID=1265817 RepID=A0ABN0RHM8_9LIST|nr:50S ribosomal protein L11 methyltransferase [Listeria floridensis]EUJ33345.1 ribosomal protein L11 methyltransferase [Listeria floridensis FSL S10-1187]